MQHDASGKDMDESNHIADGSNGHTTVSSVRESRLRLQQREYARQRAEAKLWKQMRIMQLEKARREQKQHAAERSVPCVCARVCACVCGYESLQVCSCEEALAASDSPDSCTGGCEPVRACGLVNCVETHVDTDAFPSRQSDRRFREATNASAELATQKVRSSKRVPSPT